MKRLYLQQKKTQLQAKLATDVSKKVVYDLRKCSGFDADWHDVLCQNIETIIQFFDPYLDDNEVHWKDDWNVTPEEGWQNLNK